ncbi:unnamed protein product [Schistosoma spindalis]|nr:unnamed protein product [Schistosoma spindale]
MLFTEFQLNTLKIIHSLYQQQQHHHHYHHYHHHHHLHHLHNNNNNNSHSNSNHYNNTTNHSNTTNTYTTTTTTNTTTTNTTYISNDIIINTTFHINNSFYDILYKIILFIKIILYSLIIISALFGNGLVFISYIKYKQLRMIHTNIFILSLSIADFIVALFVMPLNAIMSLLNYKWIFGKFLCNFYNATDVLFSTSSILHLCCISMERYIAILYPLNYQKKMSKKYIILLLCIIWTLSFIISYIPIFMELHKPLYYNITNRSSIQMNISSISIIKENIQHDHDPDHDPDQDANHEDSFKCNFNVNPYYAIISSSISFWIPSIIMILVYIRIFIEARKQERKIAQLYTPYISQINNTIVMQQINHPNHNHNHNKINSIPIINRTMNRSSISSSASSSSSSSSTSPSSPSSLSLSSKLHHLNEQYQSHIKIHYENKAAHTLGIVMGAFLLCWLPFFLWYTITNLCKQCQYPNELQEILYWIGYFNSSINPIIYAYYNRTFRQAFIKIIELYKGNINNYELPQQQLPQQQLPQQQQQSMDHYNKLPITRRYKYDPVHELMNTRGGN